MKQTVQEPLKELISWVEDIKHKNGSSAASLYIIKDDQVVLEHYSGRHSHEKNASHITEKAQFNVASARKSYLGLTIAYALHDKYISALDDPITQYVPEFDKDLYKDTTIRHLVTHSHGLDSDEYGYIFREFKPGSSWAYRNVGVDIMTKLIHRLYGKGFPQLLNERVFTPWGLVKRDGERNQMKILYLSSTALINLHSLNSGQSQMARRRIYLYLPGNLLSGGSCMFRKA